MTNDERIENLEKGLSSARRFSRCLLAAVGLALGVWILAGTFWPTMAAAPAGGGAVKEIRANRFVVEDANGKARVLLDATKDMLLELLDEKGNYRGSLSMDATGARLHLSQIQVEQLLLTDGRNSNSPQILMAMFDNVPSLQLCDEHGKGRVGLLLSKDGPRLYLGDENGKSGIELIVSSDGPKLNLNDDKERTRIGMGVNKNGSGISLFDENSNGRVGLKVDKNGPQLRVSDEKGNARATVGVTHIKAPDGRITTYPESSLQLWGTDGRIIWQAQ